MMTDLCFQGYSCYCHPCQPVTDTSSAAAQIGRSEIAAIAMSAAVVLAVIAISVYMLRMVRMPAVNPRLCNTQCMFGACDVVSCLVLLLYSVSHDAVLYIYIIHLLYVASRTLYLKYMLCSNPPLIIVLHNLHLSKLPLL